MMRNNSSPKTLTWLEALAPAKVNLFLELHARRADGYHELESVIVTVGLFDRLRFVPRSDNQIQITCRARCLMNETGIPAGPDNLVWRAVDRLRHENGVPPFGVDVVIDKSIPEQAGLGGGSSDAATTLLAINQLFDLNISNVRLKELAAALGSDVPFFLSGPAALCAGRGEKTEKIPTSIRPWFVIAKPPVGLATADVFQQCEVSEVPNSSETICAELRSGNLQNLGRVMTNRLQGAAEKMTNWIARLAAEFDRLNALGHQMTGSGSSYFGLFGDTFSARRAARVLRSRIPEVATFCVSGLGCGPVITYDHAK